MTTTTILASSSSSLIRRRQDSRQGYSKERLASPSDLADQSTGRPAKSKTKGASCVKGVASADLVDRPNWLSGLPFLTDLTAEAACRSHYSNSCLDGSCSHFNRFLYILGCFINSPANSVKIFSIFWICLHVLLWLSFAFLLMCCCM